MMRRNRVRGRRSVSFATGVVEKAILPGPAHQGMIVRTWMKEPSSDADSDLFGLDWGDDNIANTNSVTEGTDRTRGGKELLAFVDSGAVDTWMNMVTWYAMYGTMLGHHEVQITLYFTEIVLFSWFRVKLKEEKW